MDVYLLRHGETDNNLHNIHQPAHSELSTAGKKQIRKCIPLLKQLPLDVIITSPLKRALQTTDIISQHLQIPVIEHDGLKEKVNPSAIIGRDKYDEDVLAIKKQIEGHYHNKDWRHSDEETYFDLHARILKFINWLIRSDYHSPLLVTHEVVIKMVTAHALFGKKLNSEIFLYYYTHVKLANGSISKCCFQNGVWNLTTLGLPSQ